MPPLRELQLCRHLRCSWRDLQEMPEDTLAVWQAVIAGEEQAQRQQRAAAK